MWLCGGQWWLVSRTYSIYCTVTSMPWLICRVYVQHSILHPFHRRHNNIVSSYSFAECSDMLSQLHSFIPLSLVQMLLMGLSTSWKSTSTWSTLEGHDWQRTSCRCVHQVNPACFFIRHGLICEASNMDMHTICSLYVAHKVPRMLHIQSLITVVRCDCNGALMNL